MMMRERIQQVWATLHSGLLHRLRTSPSPLETTGVKEQPNLKTPSSSSRYLLGGLGESRVMYALDEDWQVISHRQLDPFAAQGTVISADPNLDMARRIDHSVSERVQIAEFASDIGEILLSAKTKARSGLTQIFARKAPEANQDGGESLGAVQAIQERGWWLCTPSSRLQGMETSTRVVPIASVLLKLLDLHSRGNGPIMETGATVVALVFESAARDNGQEDALKIVCLATFTAAGHLEGLDFVPVSGLSTEQVISNYVSVRRLDADGQWPRERLVLANTADPQVKKWISTAPSYPRQKTFLGLPLPKAARLGFSVSGVALAFSVGYSAIVEWQLTQIRSDISQAQSSQSEARTQAISAIRERSLGYVLSHSGLNSQRAIDLAVQVWQPGTFVELQAKQERVTLIVSALLGQNDDKSAGATLINANPPAGCSAAPTQVNSSMNQLVITYECTLQNPELERMRAAGF